MTIWKTFKKQIDSWIDFPVPPVPKAKLQPKACMAGTGSYGVSYLFEAPSKNQNVARQKSLLKETKSSYSAATLPDAYSHGLEKIYQLQTIDPKTVRVMGAGDKKETSQVDLSEKFSLSDQLEFDFGVDWRNWITPCFLAEPIAILQLSAQAEKSLTNENISSIADLIKVERSNFGSLRLGQGHKDEISLKLKEFINGRSTQYSEWVDVKSWLRGVFKDCSNKHIHIVLQNYGFQDVIQTPTHIAAEFKKLKDKAKHDLFIEAIELLRETKANAIHERFREIVHAFITPWAIKRQGILTRYEIEERFQAISVDANIIPMLHFMNDLFQTQDSIFESVYQLMAKGVYCVDSYAARLYICVVNTATSYFYKTTVYYGLDELVTLIQRELAQQWGEATDAEVVKALKCCPCFRIRKGEDEQLTVRLSLT